MNSNLGGLISGTRMDRHLRGKTRSLLMDVFPLGPGALLRCSFSSKW